MSKFSTITISDLGKTITGKTPSSESPEDFGSGIPFVTPSDPFNQKYIERTERYLSGEGANKLKGKLLPPESVIVTCIGSAMGKIAMTKESSITNQQINSIIVSDNYSPDYVYYALRNNYKLLRNAAGGSTALPLLNKSDFDLLKVRVHSKKDEQQIIAAVLSTLDDKIEYNNRINAELEAMAKTLYDYWFVQFDFPDENGKPYKSSGGKMVYNPTLKREIPVGWKAVSLSSITPVSVESINPADFPGKEYRHFSIPIFDRMKTYGLEYGESIGSNKFHVKGTDLLVSKLNPWFNRVVYAIDEPDQICSTEFVIWRCHADEIKNFLYLVATSQQFISHCVQAATGTSNSHKRVNPTIMMCYEVPYKNDIVEKFGLKIDSFLKKMIANQKETKELTQLRDWLLPMLMNGQVTVA